ncbi:MAG TPA: hypothetical protein VM536_19525 [Chloroflexia bacterium]|nr:hypothetical protein [Chloroflexia bacterium]
MIRYYVLAFDGQLFESRLYPAVWRAYYLNDFSLLEWLTADYPLLRRYEEYAQAWTRKGCRRPLKHFTTGVCEHNSKSWGLSRVEVPRTVEGGADTWTPLIAMLEQQGRCTLLDVPCGQNHLIHPDLIDLCRYKTATGRSWQLGTPAQREFIHAAPADERYANFVDLVAGALAAVVAVPPEVLGLLRKLGTAFRADLEIHYTGDQGGFLGYLTTNEATHLHGALAGITLADPVAQQYLECLRGFVTDARDHASGLVLEAV